MMLRKQRGHRLHVLLVVVAETSLDQALVAGAQMVPSRSGSHQVCPPPSVSTSPWTAGASELSSDDKFFFSSFLACFSSFFFFFSISLRRFSKLYWFLAKSASVRGPLRVEKHENHGPSTCACACSVDCNAISSTSHAISAISPLSLTMAEEGGIHVPEVCTDCPAGRYQPFVNLVAQATLSTEGGS